jgi:hypothetical protein
MKKFTAILFSILLCTLISMLATNPAQAIEVEELTWFPPYLEKDDDVVIYGHGASVDLNVPVTNNVGYPDGLNVSKVIISFDWGQNKTLDLSANMVQIGFYETKNFTVSFIANATEAVSSEWAHDYMIYVEHEYGTWIVFCDSWWPAYYFVVYPVESVLATIDVDPDTLNLKSRGQWITAYIELPEGYDVSDIDVSTVMLNTEIQAEIHPTEIGDYDTDGIPDLMVKFDRAEVMALLSVGEATLTITGEVDGTPFEGSDTIRVR